jgi:hypothetical protein
VSRGKKWLNFRNSGISTDDTNQTSQQKGTTFLPCTAGLHQNQTVVVEQQRWTVRTSRYLLVTLIFIYQYQGQVFSTIVCPSSESLQNHSFCKAMRVSVCEEYSSVMTPTPHHHSSSALPNVRSKGFLRALNAQRRSEGFSFSQ